MNKGMNKQVTKEVHVAIHTEENVHLTSNQRYVNGNNNDRPFFTSQIGKVGKRVRKWSLPHTACGSTG